MKINGFYSLIYRVVAIHSPGTRSSESIDFQLDNLRLAVPRNSIEMSLAILKDLVMTSSDARIELINKNGHVDIIRLLNNRAPTKEIRQTAAEILRRLAIDSSDNQTLLFKTNAPRKLIKILNDPTATARTKEYAVETLFWLSIEPSHRSELVKLGGIPGGLAVLKPSGVDVLNRIDPPLAEAAAAQLVSNLTQHNHHFATYYSAHTSAFKCQWHIAALQILERTNTSASPQLKEAAATILRNLSESAISSNEVKYALLFKNRGGHTLLTMVGDPTSTPYAVQSALIAVNTLYRGTLASALTKMKGHHPVISVLNHSKMPIELKCAAARFLEERLLPYKSEYPRIKFDLHDGLHIGPLLEVVMHNHPKYSARWQQSASNLLKLIEDVSPDRRKLIISTPEFEQLKGTNSVTNIQRNVRDRILARVNLDDSVDQSTFTFSALHTPPYDDFNNDLKRSR